MDWKLVFVVCMIGIGLSYAFSLNDILMSFTDDWFDMGQIETEEQDYQNSFDNQTGSVAYASNSQQFQEDPVLDDLAIMPQKIDDAPPASSGGQNSTKLTYSDMYAEYFGYTYIHDNYVRAISLSTKSKNNTPIYVVSVFFELETIDLNHIYDGPLGSMHYLEVEYKKVEDAKTMYELLNAKDGLPEIWFNTEECYYQFDDRKDPKGTKFAYCIIDPSRGKDQLRVGHDIQ
ncbi:MAG: hypothetical protein ABH842_03350 [Candidatus Micrarchaeota archaeon]